MKTYINIGIENKEVSNIVKAETNIPFEELKGSDVIAIARKHYPHIKELWITGWAKWQEPEEDDGWEDDDIDFSYNDYVNG